MDIFSWYQNETDTVSTLALSLSGCSFLAVWQFLKDPKLFTDPCSQKGPLPNLYRPGQEGDMLGTGVGASGWQGIGHCCIECFVLWNYGQ